MSIIAPIPRNERRQMKKLVQKTKDKNLGRRLIAILMLHEGHTVTFVAASLCAGRSSVNRWINWFTQFGLEGLYSLSPGRAKRWPSHEIIMLLRALVKHTPQQFGYLRTRWSTELLTLMLNKITSYTLHSSTVRRWMRKAGLVWRRAVPTLCIKDPHKEEKMAAIHQALEQCSAAHPVFYSDEADIDLNPRIGADWQIRGQQTRVVTPGKNEKHYIAGALHSTTGQIQYVLSSKKNSWLFINMMEKLRSTYRRAETITLIVDNYIIHKSKKVQVWLKNNPKFILLYQPIYSPWVNIIERLWLALHETVTRNHKCRYLWQLIINIRKFMEAASPFPGNQHGTARV